MNLNFKKLKNYNLQYEPITFGFLTNVIIKNTS